MERITIKNFLIFDDVEMELNKFNILIGPQASGKSLLAKLVYYFKNIGKHTTGCIQDNEGIDELYKVLKNEFLIIFPKEYWEDNSEFIIEYQCGNFKIEIKNNSNNSDIELKLTDDYESFYEEVKEGFEKYKIEALWRMSLEDSKSNLGNAIGLKGYFRESNKFEHYSQMFDDIIFIPASRSFFSALINNIWTLSDQIDIDPMMKNFGKSYEYAQLIYKNIYKKNWNFLNNISDNKSKKFSYTNRIIKGNYEKINGKDWIVGDNYKIELSRASSGQQEAFPLLMTLVFNALGFEFVNEPNDNNFKKYFFIEEPEAHLFPNAQNTMISLISMLKHELNVDFFITTHSPYILSAINNSILANEVIKKEKLTTEEYICLSDGAYPIDLNDISAFAVDNGNITDIKDYEYNMIGGDILDSVSNEFGQVMDHLMELDN